VGKIEKFPPKEIARTIVARSRLPAAEAVGRETEDDEAPITALPVKNSRTLVSWSRSAFGRGVPTGMSKTFERKPPGECPREQSDHLRHAARCFEKHGIRYFVSI